LLSPAERAVIDAGIRALEALQTSTDAARIEAQTKQLANDTEGFAAARMNRGIAQALSGKTLDAV
jgi:molecular chaperone HscA